MNPTNSNHTTPSDNWFEIVSRYNYPDNAKSWWQVVNSVVPYFLLWIAMYYSLEISYWLTLFLSVFAAGFLVRIFIIFHDCGHGSFFKSEPLGRWIGIGLGILVFTPYHRWHHDHREHHLTVGNLDKRGVGDVKTLTVDEYKSLTEREKRNYRFYRHPLFLIIIAPMLLFVISFRTTKEYMSSRQKLYVHLTSVAIAGMILLAVWPMGLKAYLLIQVPVIYMASMAGVWLFYVQHQYENVVWKRAKDWNYKEIALKGSSFYKLPRILQWFSGNIGFHHIHHLGPRIPNYNLEKCHYEHENSWDIHPVTLFESFKSLHLRLWDEEHQRLISFKKMV